MKRTWLPLVALALGWLVGCAPTAPERRPNVVIVVVDALRGDALGVNGYDKPTTPNLDAIVAAGATNFSRAYSHSTWTKPSMATLFTSLYPARHGIRVVAEGGDRGLMVQELQASWTTLAEAFETVGYQTGAVINQVHLDRSGFRQGFGSYVSSRGKGAGWINRRFFEWVEALEADRPFFGYVHYLDVHWPYVSVLKRSRQDFGPTKLDPEPPRRGNRATAWAENFDQESIRPLRARYDREVSFADEQVGNLWRFLEQRGLAEDTILLVTSDHGEGFLEHGAIQHGYAPYAEVVHIPMILRVPDRLEADPAGQISTPVGLIDVMPTLLELAGIDIPAQCEGRSLVDLMHGRAPRRSAVFSDGAGVAAARDATLAVLRFEDGGEEFFDLAEDGSERSRAECDAVCRELMSRAAKYAGMLAESESLQAGTLLTAEEIEELKALGYL